MDKNSPTKQNLSADWDWSAYFDHIHDPDMRVTLKTALDYFSTGENKQAIDLGCGHGNDTVHILKAGFQTLAIDQSQEGLDRLVARDTCADHPNLTVLKSTFQDMHLPKSDFVNASFAVPFCPQEQFQALWNRIIDALNPGGVFAGHLFGIRDSWQEKVADMNFHTAQDVQALIQPYTVLHFNEIEKDGADAVGRPKHWHIFEIVLVKE